ncbi:response regulator [Massilia arenosa]|uniref:Response regulator n=1 Tax=Zemynaea arenosa TaxID=2561931 RepID=A0A4Y9SEI9_9BURK|nr:response regulator [Massilia arenosa]TFW19191.1 response regulator [Massilia arenosa]
MSETPTGAVERPLLLLVDDDMLLLGLLSKILQRGGYDVRLASSADMALDLLAQSTREPDLALLDIAMPGMDGIALAEKLRAEYALPVMFLSASDEALTVERAAAAGAVGYLVKPIDAPRIGPSVTAALARAGELRRLRDSEERLSTALKTGRETGMAVGVLMERYRLDRSAAFHMLRERARSTQRKLNDVAAELLLAAETLNLPLPERNGKK